MLYCFIKMGTKLWGSSIVGEFRTDSGEPSEDFHIHRERLEIEIRQLAFQFDVDKVKTDYERVLLEMNRRH